MKSLLVVFYSFLIPSLLTAAAQNLARVDISGLPSIKLNFTEQDGVRIAHGQWLPPEQAEKFLTTSYPASVE